MTRISCLHPLRVAASLALAVLAGGAWAEGGTIRGKVEANPAKYLAETVVYLREVKGTWTPRTHRMDQKNMQFVPHVLSITLGDTVSFDNDDRLVHNVYSPDGEAYNLGSFKEHEKRERAFTKPGAYAQLCSIHPEMLGWVFVSQNPYAAVVDRTGGFEIKGVPPGTYKLAVWNPKLKASDHTVLVSAGETQSESFSLAR